MHQALGWRPNGLPKVEVVSEGQGAFSQCVGCAEFQITRFPSVWQAESWGVAHGSPIRRSWGPGFWEQKPENPTSG